MIGTRRTLLLSAAAALFPTPISTATPRFRPVPRIAPVEPAPEGLALDGRLVQGGHAVGRTWPGAIVLVDGEALTTASEDGWFFIGFDRDAPASTRIEVRANGLTAEQTLEIARGDFPVARIDGLPAETVEPTRPDTLERIRRETAIKAEGFASRAPGDDFRSGFRWPLGDFRVSSRWGSQRVLNGTPARPHYGIDMAAPQGTPVTAPAGGLVVLAEPDLHFEGGLIAIDHGQGLITAYLHQSALAVSKGARVDTGDLIGYVGMKGRATGPHLCWRMRWRDRQCDPSLFVPVDSPSLAAA